MAEVRDTKLEINCEDSSDENIEYTKNYSLDSPCSSNVSLDNNSDNCKIFVGNVSFNCTKREFEKFFEKFEGYIKAETVLDINSNGSKGYGFLTMRNREYAEKLLKRRDIKFKDRYLRFTPYKKHVYKTLSNDNTNNYVYVNGIPNTKDKEWLKKQFLNYGPIGKYYIAMNHETGKYKNNGFLEIIEDTKYNKLIEKRYHIVEDDIKLETLKHKCKNYHKINIKPKVTPNNYNLHSVFMAGSNTGYTQGLRLARMRHRYR